MFGQTNDNQQAGPAPTVQNPSMLDNVATQDLQPATQQVATQPNPPVDPQAQASAQEHPITTDNPFAQSPVLQTPPADPMVQSSTQSQAQSSQQASQPEPVSVAPAPSEPSTAPVFSTTPSDDSSATVPDSPVDHAKLAGMKQDAMTHLEPLVGHIDGTPEETFKTTMMMIQANDNHTLIDKALDAAKKITDDKERAEALLDIINEINYFSQASTQ